MSESRSAPRELAALIREVDGNHDCGAGELAERLIARGVRVGTDAPPTVRDVYWLAERVGVRVTHPCGAPVESWETALHPRGCQCQNDE